MCADPAPCLLSAITELILHADGTEEAVGEAPPPLCEGCPERESSRSCIRHIEVVLDRRNHHGYERSASAATLPPVGLDEGDEERRRTPQTTDADDGIPAAWGLDHPTRLALEGREPPHPRRRGDAGVFNSPEDFGL